jgi:hypothetical protein
VTLLGKSTSRRKESCIECLKTREIAYISLVTRTLLVLQIAPRDLPNRVTTPFTLVGNSADSRRLAQCRVTVCCTLPNAQAHRCCQASGAAPGSATTLTPYDASF